MPNHTLVFLKMRVEEDAVVRRFFHQLPRDAESAFGDRDDDNSGPIPPLHLRLHDSDRSGAGREREDCGCAATGRKRRKSRVCIVVVGVVQRAVRRDFDE